MYYLYLWGLLSLCKVQGCAIKSEQKWQSWESELQGEKVWGREECKCKMPRNPSGSIRGQQPIGLFSLFRLSLIFINVQKWVNRSQCIFVWSECNLCNAMFVNNNNNVEDRNHLLPLSGRTNKKQSYSFHVQRRLLRIFRCNSNCFFVCEQLLKTIPKYFHNSLCLAGEVLLYYLLVLKRTPSIPKLLHLFTFCWCLKIFVGYCSSCWTWSFLWVVMEFTIAMDSFPLLFITVDLVMIDIWLYI